MHGQNFFYTDIILYASVSVWRWPDDASERPCLTHYTFETEIYVVRSE